MHFSYGTLATLAFAFATLGDGHLIMKSPVPFGVGTLNNSPLNNAKPGTADSDYPCKQRPGVYDISKMNSMPVGAPQLLSFEGSASHGGGTCQIAVTKDKEPTANSTFKIIQVFEGGCPTDSNGNGGTHPFTFTIPKDFPNGVMTLAWLWYNRIGNRELYMNCAPITVTGGADNDDVFDSLPNIYLINMPTSECQSTADGGSDSVIIPHPGQYIMREPRSQDLATASGVSCAASAAAMTEGVKGYKAAPIITNNGAAYNAPGGVAAPSAAPSGAPSGSAPAFGSAAPSAGPSGMPSGAPSAAPSGGAPSMSAAPSGAPSGSAPAGSGIISMSVAPSAPAGSGAPSVVPSGAPSGSAPIGSAPASGVPSAAPSAVPSAVPSAAPSGSGAAPSAPAASGGSCSDSSGAMSCSSDGKQFGVCANGSMVWRAVAPGTTCSGGQITKRNAIRNVHVRRHLQRGGRHRAVEFY